MKVFCLKTNDGYYVSDVIQSDRYSYPDSKIKNCFINGKLPEPTFCRNWFRIDSVPEFIQVNKKGAIIRKWYEISDKNLVSDKIPESFEYEDVFGGEDEEGDTFWKGEYSNIKPLYVLRFDFAPDYLEAIGFELVMVGEFDVITPDGFSYPTAKGQPVLYDNIQYSTIDKIIYPSPALPARPCILPSCDVYNILRDYIKKNINHDYAKITSDYDFCFTVKKIIGLTKPEPYTVTIGSGKRARKEKKYHITRDVEVFEMTWSPENYRGYTPIQPIRGDNLDDLKNNIDELCRSTIEMINEPLVDCPTCNGFGVIYKK